MKDNRGFTLVEMLVVISMLSIVGVLLLTIFTRSLRGGNKAQIIETIKQNGQSVLETMDKTIRNSDRVVCISTPPVSLILEKDRIYTRYRFMNLTSTTANGSIQQDNPVKEEAEDEDRFADRVCPVENSLENPVVLTDANLQSGTSVKSGSFTRMVSAGFKDQVTVKFELEPGVGAPQLVRGQIDPVSFQTTIQLR